MINKVGNSFGTIESQDEAYFNYIRDCIITSGVKAMQKAGIEPLGFEFYFDSQRKIIISSEIIGAIDKETVNLSELLNYNNRIRSFQPVFDNTNHFGSVESFKLGEQSLLSTAKLVSRHNTIGNGGIYDLFLSRNKFDYLMGFTDEYKN